jgi:catechol-2,3-dioxygenase
MSVIGMNHAVLYARDARRSAAFYRDVLDFRVVAEDPSGRYVFLRAPRSQNHHDLAFFTVGAAAGPSEAGRRTVGLYHVAWEVEHLGDLEAMRDRLTGAGALVGSSDHGTSKSLYAVDPDGLEFEVMWAVPAHLWGDDEHAAAVRPLDLAADLRRYAGAGEG